MRNLIFCIVTLTLLSIDVNGQTWFDYQNSGCGSETDIMWDCGGVDFILPDGSGSNFEITWTNNTTVTRSAMVIDSDNGAITFNDASNPSNGTDFSISSAGNANMFFVDVSTNTIGIGTNSPTASAALHVTNNRLLADNPTNTALETQGYVIMDLNQMGLEVLDCNDSELFQITSCSTGVDPSIHLGAFTGATATNVDISIIGNIDLATEENDHLIRMLDDVNQEYFVFDPNRTISNEPEPLFILGSKRHPATIEACCRQYFAIDHVAGSNSDFTVFTHENNSGLGSDVYSIFVNSLDGNVGIGNNSPNQQLEVTGNARITAIPGMGSYPNDLGFNASGDLGTYSSDERLKKNITPMEDILPKLMMLEGKYYHWIADENGRKDIGFIAQDVEEIFPEVVFTNQTDGYMGINYSRFPAILTAAIQEQQTIIKEKEEEISDLQGEVAGLNSEVTDLNDRLARLEAMLLDNSGNTTKPNNGAGKPALGDVMGTLLQNTPNPFDQSTTIRYTLANAGSNAHVTVMNISGKELLRKKLENAESGQVVLDMSNLGSGIYFYSLVVDGSIIATKPMVKM